jgi:site-specific recombinase XerD
METGMRRAAVVNLNIEGIDWEDRLVAVTEKGGMIHSYPISDQGLQSIRDYITHERQMDNTDLLYALFLPAMTTHNSNGRLTPLVVNQEWEEVCAIAK